MIGLIITIPPYYNYRKILSKLAIKNKLVNYCDNMYGYDRWFQYINIEKEELKKTIERINKFNIKNSDGKIKLEIIKQE